jgi:hypothetical protein
MAREDREFCNQGSRTGSGEEGEEEPEGREMREVPEKV